MARDAVAGADLSPSYRPMWALAEPALTTVDKGLRLLPPRSPREGI
ncbi:MAG: hypothetical protein ACRENY_10365 [Candidatus Dormibacteria bacterium]